MFTDVCILSHGNWEESKRAAKSAWDFGIHVHLGVTIDADCTFSHSLLTTYRCAWKKDFALVRNLFLSQIKSNKPFLLWLDSDEKILSCPEILPKVDYRPIYNVLLSHQSDFTPMVSARLHRNDSTISWTGVVHERLVHNGGKEVPEPLLFPGLSLVHYGYEKDTQNISKINRNEAIANQYKDDDSGYPGILTSLARKRLAQAECSAMDWLNVYKTTDLFCRKQGLSIEMCWESAAHLAYCGYPRIAEVLVKQNPLIIPLQLALSVAHYTREGKFDQRRFSLVLTCLQRYLWDQKFPFDQKLPGADKEYLEAYIKKESRKLERNNLHLTKRIQKPSMIKLNQNYSQVPGVLLESFENDTMLLSPNSDQIVSLNESGKIFWDLLKDKITIMECADILAEAEHTNDPANQINHVKNFFEELLRNNLIAEV